MNINWSLKLMAKYIMMNETKEYDSGREAELKKFGLIVLRFTNHQVIYKLDEVILRIHGVLTELTPL